MRPKLVIVLVLVVLATLAAISTYLTLSDQPEEVAEKTSSDMVTCAQPSSFQSDAGVNISSMTSSPEKESSENPSMNSTAGPDSTPIREEEIRGQLRYADLCVGMIVCEHHPGGKLQEGVILDTNVPNQSSYPLDYPLVMIRFQMPSGPLDLQSYTVGWGFEPWPNGVWNGSWFTGGRCDGSQGSSARSV